MKKLIETIFAKHFARNYEKKIIPGTSDAWSMSRSSHRPSDPGYYIEDCRIFHILKAWNENETSKTADTRTLRQPL